MARRASRKRFIRFWTSFASLLICLPAAAGAQNAAGAQKQFAPPNWQLTIDGLAQVQVRVIWPRNFLELAENGTLRRLELLIPKGPISDLLYSASADNKRVERLDLKADARSSDLLIVTMWDVVVTPASSSSVDDPMRYVSLNFTKVESKPGLADAAR